MLRRFHPDVDASSVRSGSSMNSAASMMTSSSIASDTPTYAAYSAPNSPVSGGGAARAGLLL
jgi:hypothetical protein